MDTLVEDEHLRTSTPVESLDVPHLLDPGEDLSDSKGDDRETPDFVVRLGTSLARSEAGSQYKLLKKEFFLRPLDSQKVSKQNQSANSGGTSIRSSGRVSPIRRRSSVISLSNENRRSSVISLCNDNRRSSVTSISTEQNQRLLRRGLGRLRRRMSTKGVLFPPSPSPKEDLTPREPRIVKFRRIAKSVLVVSGIWIWLKRYTLTPNMKDWSFMEMYIHVRDDMNQVLAFNPNTYGKFEPLRDKLKELLLIPKERRTLQNIQVIMALMRDNASFQDYPVHTQIQLARCMQYQSYETRRVILKQGHPPSMFYIMLTGTAIVNILDQDPRTGNQFVRTVHELNGGDTFGEIALIHGGVRTASIICKTTCEFLVVMKEDFDVIIKEPLRKQKEQHVEFCKSLMLFKDFPCDRAFHHNTNQFFYQYFKPDDVIVKDSRESKYIIVVKAGKCKIVSDFQGRRSETRPDRIRKMFHPEIEEAFPLYTTMKKIRAMDPCPRTDHKANSKDTFRIGLLTGTIDRDKLVNSVSSKITENAAKSDDTPVTQRRHSADPHRKHERSNRRSKSSKPRLIEEVLSYEEEYEEHQRDDDPLITAYAQISELKTGQVFGLESLISTPSTQLSLVSEGAECILISKRLFLKEANVKVLRIVTDLVQNYPSHDYIKNQVHIYRKWVHYKADLEREVLTNIRRKNKAWIGGVPAKARH
ncbi:cyclic nucleotide-binding domain-containing protein 2-like isoform X2 [Crassostrea angulata]|uniref:cyclic nucleotide-binding domain-containing protein 2-like isoform X2 n=1 Tax=Magallana angulata TaxID=2784310 RepID=UPI0022B0EBA0|nr:cyclic nucleotide-binding domain-containing protein 2-like isoform X2 [Crassostrea angulata]